MGIFGGKPIARHRTYSIEFRRHVAQEFLGGETLNGLARRHDVSRNLIRVWVAKYEAVAFDDEFQTADFCSSTRGRLCHWNVWWDARRWRPSF